MSYFTEMHVKMKHFLGHDFYILKIKWAELGKNNNNNNEIYNGDSFQQFELFYSVKVKIKYPSTSPIICDSPGFTSQYNHQSQRVPRIHHNGTNLNQGLLCPLLVVNKHCMGITSLTANSQWAHG